jgi:hypothetical protein
MLRPRPSATASSDLGCRSQAGHPRHSLDTAPKGVETHPGDGRLSVGNAQCASLTYIPCIAAASATVAQHFSSIQRRAANRSHEMCRFSSGTINQPDPRTGVGRRHAWAWAPHASTHSSRVASSIPRGCSSSGESNRAARPHKNLSQVLKNMDSPSEKSTVQSRCHHFVSICPWPVQALRSKKRLVLIRELNKRPRPGVVTARSSVARSLRRCYTESRWALEFGLGLLPDPDL